MAVHFLRNGRTELEYIKVAMLGFLHLKLIISNQICLFVFESKVRTCQEYRQSGLQVALCRWYFFPKLFISSYLENK